MVWVLRPLSDTASVIKPKPCSFWLLLRYLKSFFAPYSINSIFTYAPSISVKKPCYFTITISAIEFCKVNYSLSKSFLILAFNCFVSACASMNTDNFAGPSFRSFKLLLNMRYSFPLNFRA